MSEHIPQWVLFFFGLGSPVQEFLNRWIPERLRPLTLWGVAGLIVAAAILATPLVGGDFWIQLPLVYAALTAGWALSRVVEPPLPASSAALRALVIVGSLSGVALFVTRAWAQVDSTATLTGTEAFPAAAIANFIWAQLASFIGASLVRWLSPKRK